MSNGEATNKRQTTKHFHQKSTTIKQAYHQAINQQNKQAIALQHPERVLYQTRKQNQTAKQTGGKQN
jgi:hypothetical protein